MPVHDDLGNRMKDNYESISKTRLVRRMPVIIRIDGKAFHTFTKGFDRPFDSIMSYCMHETTKYLCENIQGCVLGYTQSDEISLLLIDYKKLETNAWFDNEVQKMCSISASMATMIFNKTFSEFVNNLIHTTPGHDNEKYLKTLIKAKDKGAMFDSRVFNIPKEEVTNYFYWREIDAMRNSVEMVGRAHFSQKQLQHKSCNMIKDMLKSEKNIDWDEDIAIPCQRGICCIKEGKGIRNVWKIDINIPVFKDEGREYIEKLLIPEEE